MSKRKLERFAELGTFQNVIQPDLEDIFKKDHYIKGRWNEKLFLNTNPIVIELGCGKGEYTTGMAEASVDKNYVGIDIKGARMWKGAKYAHDARLLNAAFLRIRIDHINSLFAADEVSEIWVTFPDPYENPGRSKKRLTSSVFLSLYQDFLKNDGLIHLKTDNKILYDYTLNLCLLNKLDILFNTEDLYQSSLNNNRLQIKTHYESIFLSKGVSIKYLCFRLKKNVMIIESEHTYSK